VRENPVAFLAFDVLYADGALMIERPLRDRAMVLDGLLAGIRTPERKKGEFPLKTGRNARGRISNESGGQPAALGPRSEPRGDVSG